MPASYTQCAPRNRCRNYRRCSACAQIRQAQVADVAARGAVFSPNITYAVVRTTSPRTLKDDKAVLQKHLQAVALGGMWTVEKGAEVLGLHLNLLIGSAEELDAPTIAAGWPAAGEVWAQNVARDEVRNVAAYICKREGYPEREDYHGNPYGSWGEWRSPLQAVAGQTSVPEMQGMALDYQLWQQGVAAPIGTVLPEPEPDDSAEREAVAHRKRSSRFARVLAAAEGRVDVNGLVYVAGYGIKTLREVQGMRQLAESDAAEPELQP